MSYHLSTYIIVFLLVSGFLLKVLLDQLNVKLINPKLPKEFEGFYDQKKYQDSQNYLKDSTRLGIFQGAYSTTLFLAFLLLGGFNLVDIWARSFNYGSILTGLIFVGVLGFFSSLISLPFQYYDTFVLEEKYGFNKTNLKTFISDQVKGLLMGAVLGGIILSALFWFFESTGTYGWLYAWIALSIFQLVLFFLAPVLIFPLFNKFSPLPDGELKDAIEKFSRDQNFKLQGIFTMDGSKRSTKANAYFTGFGKFKRIVLFDTLVEKFTTKELVAILAHEIGHYKLKHIFRQISLSLVSLGVTFFMLSLFLESPFIFDGFLMENTSIYASLIFFGVFYAPLSKVISLMSLYLSRKYEFEADEYSFKSYPENDLLITALKKLSVENLSNLNPHPLKVFFEYTHPPVLDRIESLKRLQS